MQGYVDFSLTALRALCLIEETGSMSVAAKTLNITQSGVSRSIAGLEAQTGLALVIRDRRPLTLTADGQAVTARAARIERELTELAKEADQRRKGALGVLTVGSFGASASTRALPELLNAFRRYADGLQVEIREYKDAEIANALETGVIDLAVMASADPEFDQLTIGRDQLVALMPEECALTERQKVTVDDFAQYPFIRSNAGSGHLIDGWFSNARRDVRPVHTIEQLSSILAMVRAGLGVSIVAEFALPELHPGIVARPLQPAVPRIISLVRCADRERSAAANRFWQFARSYLEDV